MENAKKMILVDPDTIQRLQNFSNNNNINSNNVVESIDNEMNHILSMKHISDNDKWKKYNQVLQRFLHFSDESRKPLSMTIQSLKSAVNDNNIDQDESKAISASLRADTLEAIPKTFRSKASIIYDKLVNSDKISWDINGTAIIKGKKINGSSITDLIADVVCNRSTTNPPGWSDFADVLYSINMPQELIGNSRRKDFILQKHSNPETSLAEITPVTSKRNSVKQKRIAQRTRNWEAFNF